MVSSEGGELLLLPPPPPERASDKSAVKVRVRRGDDIDGDDPLEEERPAYQRVCVGTDDGGVISLDWPANLDLKADRGLDTTLLLVPGSARGSSEKNVRSFVRVSLGRGYFPIVMNPRGCAGSPLTTARLFTAADSDDVRTAIRFINMERPWTTLMGVGWGYGANMLTKYLSEVGDQTPLTAATCIDNPFDLEEATRSSPYHIAIGQKLTSGLISILQSNKEIFQGRAKGFDVKMALLAKSVRDFDKAISMVSYGYENIEDFYSKSSTRDVANLKIPVLFIQNDDGTVPLFSIPRNSIVENPYTSLLLCSCLPSLGSEQSAISWYLPVTIEWLTAVELGLLKGHHPLLQDVDVSLNPATSLAFLDRGLSKRGDKVTTRLLDLAQSDVANGYSGDPIFDMLAGSDVSHSQMNEKYLQKDLGPEDKSLQSVNSGTLQPVKSDETESVQQDVVMDTEKGQGLQTAQVVMNMLDITLPDTLNEEEKKQVLTAVDQGETLMKALQDAVPEDVRDKLTTAASEILHAQGSNLGRLPKISLGLTSNIKEKVSGLSTAGVNSHSSDERKMKDDQVEWADNNQPDMIRRSGGQESEFQPLYGLQTGDDLNKSESISTYGGDDSVAVKKGSDKSDKDEEKAIQCSDYNEDKLETGDEDNHSSYGGDVSVSVKKGSDENDKHGEQAVQYSDYNEDKLETGDKDNLSNLTEKASGTEATVSDPCPGDIDSVNNQLDKNEENSFQKNAEKLVNFSSDQDTTHKPAQAEETVSAQKAGPQAQLTKSENVNTQKMEDESTLPVPDNNNPIFSNADPAFSVTEAFDALTGIDDSTQVAVNSVFGVIEDMITQYAEKEGNETQDRIHVKNKNSASDVKLENKKHEPSIQPDISHEHSSHKGHEKSTDSQNDIRTRSIEEELTQNNISSTRNGIDSIEQSNLAGPVGNGGDERNENMVNGKLSAENSDRFRLVSDIQFCESIYGGSLYNQFLQNNILSKMPNAKQIDPNTTTALFSYYFPEGQWNLLEKPGNNGDSFGISASLGAVNGEAQSTSHLNQNNGDTIIEPAYLILDTVEEQEPVGEYVTVDRVNQSEEIPGDKSEEMTHSVKNFILDSLKVEVARRVNADDLDELDPNLARDLELIATVVSVVIRCNWNNDHTWHLKGINNDLRVSSKEANILDGDDVKREISFAIQDAPYLRMILPVSVIVSSSLAALKKFFIVATAHDSGQKDAVAPEKTKNYEGKLHDCIDEAMFDKRASSESFQISDISDSPSHKEIAKLNNQNETVMVGHVGAVTAALGASALLVHQQDSHESNENSETSSKAFEDKIDYQREPENQEEASHKKNEDVVTSLAEKAMSVAGPVVPTKEPGEVDQERLVAMLANLGQKGGGLKLFGKIALLWGGLRGAMSLTEKLIHFLHIAERPLHQRIFGFVFMVLVMWAPVVVPFLPTLVQSWTTHNPSRFAELACITGFYAAVTILVVLWGKRIRSYGNPLQQYGLDLASLPKIKNFLKGLIGGFALILLIHSVNAKLGFLSISWPLIFPSLDSATWLKLYWKMLMWAGQGIVTAMGVALVEELFFRAWLPQEIAVDLGYDCGIIISGLAFSLFQRSPRAIPGLWLLSLGLAGARLRSDGSLSTPIGLRSGIMASSYILQKGGFLAYRPSSSAWLTGTHPFEPFSGVVGLIFCLLLAIVLYPRQPLHKKV